MSYMDYGIPANYTETLQELIYNILVEDEGIYTEEEFFSLTVSEQIAAAKDYIFEEYPIFDENYRDGLNEKILRHFYAREIGAEQEDAFLYYLNRELIEIMPYYNKLYLTETLKFNPLYTVNKTSAHAGERQGDGKESGYEAGEQSEETKQADVGSTKHSETEAQNGVESNAHNESSKATSGITDTPQGAVTGLENALTPSGSGYLTSANIGNTEGKSSDATATAQETQRSSTDDRADARNGERKARDNRARAIERNSGSVDNYIDSVVGYEGNPSELIQDYRKTLLNIDMDIIKRLESCFMLIW